MWQNYLQWLLMLAVFIVLMVVGYQNMDVLDQTIQFQIFNYIRYTKIGWAILASFGAGALIMLVVSLVQNIGLRLGMRGLRRDNERIRQELTRLRNLNVDGGSAIKS